MTPASKYASAAEADGNTVAFDANWRRRDEAQYNHWTRSAPKNQIQLAFRSHWEVFKELLGDAAESKGLAIEVGCGRGSLSSYFADDGWDCVLLDYSPAALEIARAIFRANDLPAVFTAGDANQLPFPDDTFDVCSSIGLLEHFEDVRTAIAEQLRILKPGGWFLGYIVPERPDNVQRYFRWFNAILRRIARHTTKSKSKPQKDEVFRSDIDSEGYLTAIEDLPFTNVHVFGMYPMPMISHSPEFPFSLLPAPAERILVRVFKAALRIRRMVTGRHGWICSESVGQAFLLAFQKRPE